MDKVQKLNNSEDKDLSYVVTYPPALMVFDHPDVCLLAVVKVIV
jgi:hypothetical protein